MSWSNLPKDLLVSVAKRLDTRIDILRFRAVCCSWRSSISPPKKSPPLPLNLPFPIYSPDIIKLERRGYFTLSETTVYSVKTPPSDEINHGAGTGWLLRVKETESGKVQILDLFERNRINQFPQTSSSMVFNLLNFRVSEVTKCYNLQYVDIDNIPDIEAAVFTFHKVVVSSNPVSTDDDYAVLAINYPGHLCYTRLGDDKWTVMLSIKYDGKLEPLTAYDLIDHKGKFYVVDQNGKVVVFNYSLEVIGKFAAPTLDAWNGNLHFFESLGDLFLVDKHFNWTITGTGYASVKIKVYKLDEEEGKWNKVNNLGDRALFVCHCHNCYFSVSVQEFAGCKGNCIYFITDVICKGLSNLPICVCQLEDCSPGFSNIFCWPPTLPTPISSSSS